MEDEIDDTASTPKEEKGEGTYAPTDLETKDNQQAEQLAESELIAEITADEDIINIVTYLRFVENERILSGEIDKPVVEEKLVFPEN